MITTTQPIREVDATARAVTNRPVAGMFPLSFAQEGLWIEEQITASSAYNMPEAWILRGRLDVTALRKALNAMVERHETLRTVFRVENGTPVQVIFQQGTFSLKEAWPGSRRQELDRIVAEETCRRFDLANGPLARAVLCRISEEEHFLLVNMHHLIGDAWSQAVFVRDLAELYSAELAGQRNGMPELPIQFADYAAWQRETFEGQELPRQVEWWRKRLADAPRPAALPADLPRPIGTAAQAARTRFYFLDAELAGKLSDLSRAEHTTLFTTLTAAFAVLLHRATGEEDILIGCPMAGRDRVETERLIGLFVNTHALRTSLRGNPKFEEVLEQVKEGALGALSNQFAPLNRIVDAVKPQRGGGNPLFRTVFGLQTEPVEGIRMTDVSLERVELDNGAAKFDWTVLATRTNRGISIRSEHRSGLYKDETIERAMSQFRLLLEQIADCPRKSISDYDLLSARHCQLILGDWNKTEATYDRDSTVHESFARKANWHPERIALLAEGRSLTYGEVEDCATRVAAALQAEGLKPGGRVLLNFERSPELVIAMLATLKAGGVYVPLDRQYPPERQALICRESGAMLQLADQKGEAWVQAPGLKTVSFTTAAQTEASAFRPVAIAAEAPAYIMFTSGSTGTPKGAMVPHRAILRLVQNPNYVEIRGQDAFLQFAPAAFDASTFEVWGALLNSARLVIAPPQRLSLAELGKLIREKKITILWLTAGLFNQMVDHEMASLAGVKQLLAGGEALSPEHVRRALSGLPGTTIINGYGPTENTTFSCCYRVPRVWEERASIPIGKPISNSKAYILDDSRKLCAVGVPGELFVAGDGLALGYVGLPELTAEKFLMVQLTPGVQPERMYRTGDLARWLPDGTIEFLGRVDSQVKIRGFRIEPGEIEAVLLAHPCVSAALVIVHESYIGKQLVAYVVPKGGMFRSSCSNSSTLTSSEEPVHCHDSLSVTVLRDYLVSKLPGYMVPSAFMLLKNLPLTANGKVDRRALPEPDFSSGLPGQRLAPSTDAEKKVSAIWEEVLGRNGFDVRQDFFQLGGHSLLATQVASRLSQAFGTEVPVIAIFEHPTIQSLAAAIPLDRAGDGRPKITRHLPAGEARDLLSRLDALPEEEIERLLAEFEDSVN